MGRAGHRPARPRLPHLIGAEDPVVLRHLAAELTGDPEVALLKQQGPADEPTLLVAEMTLDHAEFLRRKYPRVIIEPDAPLEPLS
ncbi:hypothetical protein WJ438_09995 [Streptomyces sp. GD-15H]|uniref:hypothetical protein n=1 Tax=Streptomyces sp. GD-15H TaxID=3129112 RepID=UPI0032515291